MEKGFNSDVIVHGANYHVQTEDWGRENPFVVSRIYLNGAVIKSFKTSYQEVLQNGPVSDQRGLQLAMRDQHQKILDLLISGQLNG